jgi:hypothetical protein
MSMLDPNEIIKIKATTLTMSQAVNALNDYSVAEDMTGPEIMDMCTLFPSDNSSFLIAFRLHEISASDLELDFSDYNVGFIDEVYKDKKAALLALNDLIAQAVKPVI